MCRDACRFGHIEVVRLLLEAGTDPTIENDEGMNALQITQVRQSKLSRVALWPGASVACHSRRSRTLASCGRDVAMGHRRRHRSR